MYSKFVHSQVAAGNAIEDRANLTAEAVRRSGNPNAVAVRVLDAGKFCDEWYARSLMPVGGETPVECWGRYTMNHHGIFGATAGVSVGKEKEEGHFANPFAFRRYVSMSYYQWCVVLVLCSEVPFVLFFLFWTQRCCWLAWGGGSVLVVPMRRRSHELVPGVVREPGAPADGGKWAL
jgi:hypothetical protein